MIISLSLCSEAFAHDYIMSFLFGGTSTQYNTSVANTNNVLSAVSPDYFDINADGSLKITKLDPAFIQNMHNQGRQVTPFLSNHWDRNLGVAALNNTEAITTQLAQTIYSNGLEGVNVDIENVTQLHKDAYTNFVKRLRDKLPDKIVTVSVAANPNGWTTGWHGSYDYAKLAQYSDYLMIMAYDESYYGGPAGPVASISFAERSITYALKFAPASKLVLGVPFYGRFWKEGDTVGGSGVTNLDIQNLIQNYQNVKSFHADSKSAEVTVTIKPTDVAPKLWGGRTLDAGIYNIWYDDNAATQYKLDLVEKYKLKGSGSWALGEDIKEVWTMYASYKTAPSGQMLNGWIAQNGAWYYYINNIPQTSKWILYNGQWYYLSSNGQMASGWLSWNGNWYYLHPSGVMATGWISWNGSWYYLQPSGAMATGWISWNGSWYYLHPSGVMATGWITWNGNKYYLMESGIMATKPTVVSKVTYYFNSNGTLRR